MYLYTKNNFMKRARGIWYGQNICLQRDVVCGIINKAEDNAATNIAEWAENENIRYRPGICQIGLRSYRKNRKQI